MTTTHDQRRAPTAAPQQKTRVLIVAASLDILGGQAVQAASLIDHLQHEPSVVVGFLSVNPRLPGVLRKLQSIKYIRTVTTSVLYWAKLLGTVPKFDVIHVFSASYLSFLLAPAPAMIVAKLFKRKIILNYHSGEAEDHLRRWPRSSIPLLRMADEIVVPSNYLVRVFAKFGLASKAIFNMIDLDQFTFRERYPPRPVFLSNRNFEAHYGVDIVLRCFAIVQARFPDAYLIVIGDGPCRASLVELARELALRNIEFTGKVEHESIPDLYNRSDVFLNGSRIDNQPLSILEASASGLPVITTNAGGIPDMVTNGRTALVVNTDDHEALAESAIRILEDSALADEIISGAREECRKYTWDAVRSKWLSAYTGSVDEIGENKTRLDCESPKVTEICESS